MKEEIKEKTGRKPMLQIAINEENQSFEYALIEINDFEKMGLIIFLDMIKEKLKEDLELTNVLEDDMLGDDE